jgi:hypothetical protein
MISSARQYGLALIVAIMATLVELVVASPTAAAMHYQTSANQALALVRASMLNCTFTDTGLAVARSPSGRLYWTQTFGG